MSVKKEKSPTIETKRYHLVVPEILYKEVTNIAKERGLSTVAVIRQCIKLGLLIAKASSDTEFIIRDVKDGREKQIVLL